MDLINNLNQEQKQVVQSTEGPLLVLAGAGSGKTRCVIARTAFLIKEKRIRPWNILVVTFTNKAANELKDRLENTIKISTRGLWIGTFHSICARILRTEHHLLPVDNNFSIYDDADQKSLVKSIYKKFDIDAKRINLNAVRNIISKQKNSLIRPEDFWEFNEDNGFSEIVDKIYKEYQHQLVSNNAVDFDDLLLYTAFLFDKHPEIRYKYERMFPYVMIDEYQDTNFAQFKIVNFITSNHQNICVVGDDDQAIYSWRGADIRNILNFENDYKDVKTIKLERNYRSTVPILNLANNIIKKNTGRHAKELWTDIKSDDVPEMHILDNENYEASFVASKIADLFKKGSALNETVVLYRTNAQSRVLENAFRKEKLRYKIVGGVNFYQRKEIKDLLAYLRVLINPNDNFSLLRIINTPARGIGKASIQKILTNAASTNMSIRKYIAGSDFNNLSNRLTKRIMELNQQLVALEKIAQEATVDETVVAVVDTFKFIELYENSSDPLDISRVENIKEFVNSVIEFSEAIVKKGDEPPKLESYLQELSLLTDLDNVDDDEDSVKLMTMHNAKGLEFDHVFIVGLEDGLLPHSRSIEDGHSLEEERRLFYVAVTRARKTLTLCHCRHRRVYDTQMPCLPSRFINDIDENLIKLNDDSTVGIITVSRQKKKPNKNIVLESQKFFKIGQKIAHPKFGKGSILSVEGKGENAKLTISFANGQLKKIIGSFVKKI